MSITPDQGFEVAGDEFQWNPPRYCQEFKRNILGCWSGPHRGEDAPLFLRVYPYGEYFRACNLFTGEGVRDLTEKTLLEILSRWLHEVEHKGKLDEARRWAAPEARQVSGIIT